MRNRKFSNEMLENMWITTLLEKEHTENQTQTNAISLKITTRKYIKLFELTALPMKLWLYAKMLFVLCKQNYENTQANVRDYFVLFIALNTFIACINMFVMQCEIWTAHFHNQIRFFV